MQPQIKEQIKMLKEHFWALDFVIPYEPTQEISKHLIEMCADEKRFNTYLEMPNIATIELNNWFLDKYYILDQVLTHSWIRKRSTPYNDFPFFIPEAYCLIIFQFMHKGRFDGTIFAYFVQVLDESMSNQLISEMQALIKK